MSRVVGLTLLALVASGLVACNPVLKGVGDGLMLATGLGQPALEEKATNPGLGYLKVSSGPEALFVLGFREQGREAWFGAGPMALTIENGVVVSSGGVGDDLVYHTSSGAGATYFNTGLHTLERNKPVLLTRTRSVLSGVQQHSQTYQLVAVGEESVTIWNGQRQTLLRIEERAQKQKSGLVWPGAVYWVSTATGDVLASQQWLTPKRRFALVPREGQRLLSGPELANELPSTMVSAPMRLSDVLRQDAVWSQASALAVYSAAKQPLANRLKRGLLVDLRVAEANAKPAHRAALRAWHQQIESLSVNGRWVVPQFNAYWLDASPAHNPVLSVGDTVRAIAANAPVTVLTSTAAVCVRPYNPHTTVSDYIKACDVDVPSHAVMVQADGRVIELALGLWNRQPTPAPTPAAIIALPVAGLPDAAMKELAQLWWMEAKP